VSELENRDAQVAALVAWIEKNVGGHVTHVERQPRWRPVHFLDVERDGEVLQLVARQARADMPMAFPLRHEMVFQQVAHEHGITVPRVHGWCDEPECYVMDRVAGVPDLAGLDEGQRRTVMYAYMEELARLHTLPTELFKQAGIVHAKDPADAGMVGQRRFEALYRQDKIVPDPFVEFALGWLRRHPPGRAAHESAIVWDAGQFHREGDRFVSLIDLELTHVGDPMIDLACMRLRDTIIPYGDLSELYAHYAKLSGIAVDEDAIRRHVIFFGLCNAMPTNAARAAPPVESDYMVNLQWVNETNRYSLEGIAELAGIALPDIDLPKPETHCASAPFRHLTELVASLKTDDPILRHDLRRIFRLSRHLARWGEVGQALLAEDLDDIARLIGNRPASWAEGEAALEAFVLDDNGCNDEALILLFNRRLQRAQTLNGPAGSAMNHHHILQPYGG
jgi:aminoglycoside phosphotransferase (APT) family kinase protein